MKSIPSKVSDSTTKKCLQPLGDDRGDSERIPKEQAPVVESQQQQQAQEAKQHREEDGRNIWLNEEDSKGWELTWPIWHMLPREERRCLAQKHGYKTIGEFEEYMTLQRAVDISHDRRPYDNQLLYHNNNRTTGNSTSTAETNPSTTTPPSTVLQTTKASVRVHQQEIDGDENSVDDDIDPDENEREKEDSGDDSLLSPEEIIRRGGQILVLSDDLLHRIFAYLPVDMYATLALVSPYWKSFTRTEATYKRLCERLYLNQCQRRALHVSRFHNSYRMMLELRPRVRAGGGGIYIMKYSRVRKIQRDMWTEIPAGAVLEMTYYRYLYFTEQGRVLYALTATPPHEMFPRFRRILLTGQTDAVSVWGTYSVHKTTVTVTAQQEWHHVQFILTIDVANRIYGRYGCLLFDQHMSSTTGDFSDENAYISNRITYDVPDEPFRFVMDHRL